MKQDSRKIAIYSRKSKFTGKGESIENQIEICKSRIKSQYPDISEADILIFEDEGFSGGNMNRPKFKEMMRLVKDNKIKAIYSYRLDRISRSVVDFANMYEILTELNVSYISATECYETSTPLGRAMMSIATVFAQLERETIAERIKDNMHALAKSGRWLGGITPTGYKSRQIIGSVTVDGKERKSFMLDVIESEANVVRLIFSKFLEYNSLTKTETYLLQNGIKTKNGRNYTRFSIKSILQNPVYAAADDSTLKYFKKLGIEIYSDESEFSGKQGVMAYNKTLQRDGKTNKTKEFDEWIVAVGKHKPIIESKVWIKVQELLSQNTLKSYRKPKSNISFLSGLLYCADCGSFMRPKKSKRLNAEGEEIYSYLCEMKEKSRMHNCKMKNVNGNQLDKSICEEIKKLDEDSDIFISRLLEASKKPCQNTEEYEKQIAALKKSFAENEKQIKNLVTALSMGDATTVSYINTQITALHNKNKEIKLKISELETVSKDNFLTEDDFQTLKGILSSFASAFDTMSLVEKRAALRIFVKRIEWDGDNVHVYLLGDENLLLKVSDLQTLGTDSVFYTPCGIGSKPDSLI